MSAETDGDWLVKIGHHRVPARAVVCVPHAGAGAAAFRRWSHGLEDVASVWAVRLPGRERRLLEEPLTSIGKMADALLAPVRRLAAQDITVFGHCSGALVAYELAHRLAADPHGPSLRLVVSSQQAPGAGQPPRPSSDPGQLSAAMADRLRELGGTAEGILQQDELMELLVPALRADLDAVHDYWGEGARPPLNVPVFAVGGSEDQLVAPADLAQWKGLAAADFSIQLFDGDHFYLNTCLRQVLDYLSAIISSEILGTQRS